MRIPSTRFALVAAFGLGLAYLVPYVKGADEAKEPSSAQDRAFHRMVIYNGSLRTVHYFTSGFSRSDQSILRDLERAENELALSDQLMALRKQYVADERVLESKRVAFQQAALGAANAPYAGAAVPASISGLGGYPYLGAGYDIPVPAGVLPRYHVFDNGYLNAPGLGNLYATGLGTGGLYFYPNGMLAGAGSPYPGYSVPAGPISGTGTDGILKAELAKALAPQATPEFAALASRNYDVALAHARESDDLRAALQISRNDNINTYAGFETTHPKPAPEKIEPGTKSPESKENPPKHMDPARP